MRIYIMTFSSTTNVGAELQMFALSSYLSEQGHDVQIVDYLPQWLSQQRKVFYQLFHCGSVYNCAKQLLLIPMRVFQISKYNSFDNKYIKKTDRCLTMEYVCALPTPDAWITGSDQIWNLEITGEDNVYLLDFPATGQKLSYAASAGKDSFNDAEIKRIVGGVAKLNACMVREDALKKLLEQNGINNVAHVLDPVFLLPPNRYLEMAIKPKYNNYIFVYLTQRDQKLISLARRLADKENLIVVEMNRARRQWGVDVVLPYVTPDEFIGLIQGAHYVLTNSFHCTAFSIILQKQFFTTKLDKLNSRLSSLLNLLGLQNVVVAEDAAECDLGTKIIYDQVNIKLAEQIEYSTECLRRALNG